MQLELPSRCHCPARAMSMKTKVRAPSCCLMRRPDDLATGLAASCTTSHIRLDVHGNVAVSIRLTEGMVALLEGQLAWFPRLGVPLSPSPSSARMGQVLAHPQRAFWRGCALVSARGHWLVDFLHASFHCTSAVAIPDVLDCWRRRLRCGRACGSSRTTGSDAGWSAIHSRGRSIVQTTCFVRAA